MKKLVSDRSVLVCGELFSWVTLNKALLCALEYLVVKGHVIQSFRISAKRSCYTFGEINSMF